MRGSRVALAPVRVRLGDDWECDATDVRVMSAACGARHSLLLDEMGGVWSCGSGVVGALGLGTDIMEGSTGAKGRGWPSTTAAMPRRVSGLDNVEIIQVCGAWCCAVTSCGVRQLSRHACCGSPPFPRPLLITDDAGQIVAGDNVSAAVTEYGSLYVWGMLNPREHGHASTFPSIHWEPHLVVIDARLQAEVTSDGGSVGEPAPSSVNAEAGGGADRGGLGIAQVDACCGDVALVTEAGLAYVYAC